VAALFIFASISSLVGEGLGEHTCFLEINLVTISDKFYRQLADAILITEISKVSFKQLSLL
jgi:hypothetical protein